MLKPILDVTNLNVSLSVFGVFILAYGLISARLQQVWYFGEALPAFVLGVIVGPVAANWVNVSNWDHYGVFHDTHEIAYNVARIIIAIQLVKVGYELPKQYQKQRATEMTICLLPVMTIMWLSTTACIKLVVPKVSWESSLVIGSCVTCTDPILSQAIAKGPFAETYVRRPLREFISSEAGGNDGFGFPFLLFAVALLRYDGNRENAISLDEMDYAEGIPDQLGSEEAGRFGGGLDTALKHWAIEGVLFMVLLGFAYGAIVGCLCRVGLNWALKRKWVDNESYLLMPLAMGMFIVGTCGCFGADETLACFAAGNALNWDGRFLAEVHVRHDSFNNILERFLNFAGFIFIGLIMPWDSLTNPLRTADNGLSPGRLFALAFLVLVFRRIPAIMISYRLMPKVCSNWKEALFLGYFGPIGIGAISSVEYARQLFPKPGESDSEINILTNVMIPVVYWLVFFSIIVHGLSVGILYLIYKWRKVSSIHDSPIEVVLLSSNEPLPANSTTLPQRHSAMLNNRFSRQDDAYEEEDHSDGGGGGHAGESAAMSASLSARNPTIMMTTVHNDTNNKNNNHNTPNHNNLVHDPSQGQHHHRHYNIFHRATSSFDHLHHHHHHHHHNHNHNTRHPRNSLHGSDVIDILQHSEEGRIHKPRSSSESTMSVDRRLDAPTAATSQEMPRDMI